MNKVPTTMDSFRVEEQEGVEKDLNPKEEVSFQQSFEKSYKISSNSHRVQKLKTH